VKRVLHMAMGHSARFVATLFVCFAVSCGSRTAIAPRDDSGGSPQVLGSTLAVKQVDDCATLVQSGHVDPRVLQLLHEEPAPPAQAILPELSDLPLLRVTSAVADHWTDGAAAQQSGNGTAQGSALQLISTAPEPAWALYALTGTTAAYQLQHLRVETSGGNFSGDQPGYWIVIGDYAGNRWRVIDRTSVAAYSFSLAGSNAYLSPAKTVYAAILVAEGQSVTITRVGLERDDSLWQSLQLEAGPSSGVTPAIDFGPNNNPSVVWADSATGDVTFAICDRSLGFGNPTAWVASVAEGGAETASQEVLTDPLSPDAKAQWLDLVVDPTVALPRITMLYTGLLATKGNCRFGCTVLAEDPGLVWKNWRMRFTPDATWTSLARDPLTVRYAATWTADSRGFTPPGQLNDMVFREITWTDALRGVISNNSGEADLYFNFGSNWLYPHVRYRNTGNPTVAIRGGYVYYQSDPAVQGSWSQILGESNSLTFGSLAYASDDLPSSAFAFTGTAGRHEMRVVDFFNLGSANTLMADSKTVGASDALGETNQIGYLPNGSACIAYSERTASGVAVKYAQQNGANWVVETVSPTLSTPPSPSDLIFLDLAVDSNGIPAVCWEQRNGTATSMMVALRGS
jgi:hypothetical protein